MAMKRLNSRRQRWLEAYFGEAHCNATEAARIAGYNHPLTIGPRLRRLMRTEIEVKELELRDASKMTAVEVIEGLSEIARDKAHKDRKAALDTLAKIHGLLTDKLDLNLDRKRLVTDLEATVAQIVVALPQLPAAPAEDFEDVIS